MKIINRNVDLEYGFFVVEFDNDKSLQCCLIHDGEKYIAAIDEHDNGHDEALSKECNEWYTIEDVNETIIEQAKIAGLEIQ